MSNTHTIAESRQDAESNIDFFPIRTRKDTIGEELKEKSIAKALKRKMDFDEDILKKTEYKIGEQSLLMNSSRRRIFEYICNFPCSHLREISRAMNYSPQTVSWHIGKLSEGYLISVSTQGKKKLFTPFKNIITPVECEVLCLLKIKDVRDIFMTIQKNPKISQKKLCEQLGTYQQMLSLVLRQLIKSNLVSEEKSGRVKIYSATNKIKEIEEKFTQKSEDFINILMDALSKDSLNPKIENIAEGTVSIRLKIGGEESAYLHINLNPIKNILEV